MHPLRFLLFALLLSSLNNLKSQDFSIGKKDSIQSVILGEQRYFNVFLPASYGENTQATYPVLYLMDGDYNFMYVTGLIEQLSSMSEIIPEMIVVGISDTGHQNYILNCTPHDAKLNPEGNSEDFAAFISEELKPYMNQNFLTSECDFLMGHSLGGLFVINTMLAKPEKFQNYIAISPSLWWNDYAVEEEVMPFYKQYENLDRSLFISLGNEKGMGVLGFVDQLDIGDFSDTYLKKTPLGLAYRFERYSKENHNSVGLISLSDALKWRFKDYELTTDDWAAIDNFEKYIAHIAPLKRMIGDGYRLPENQFKVFVGQALDGGKPAQDAMVGFIETEIPASLSDYYRLLGAIQLEREDPGAAILSLRKCMELNPDDSKTYTELGKCFESKGDLGMAKHYFKKAYDTAVSHGARSWYVNQLRANFN